MSLTTYQYRPPRVGNVLVTGSVDYEVVTRYAHDNAKAVGDDNNKGDDGFPRRLRIKYGKSGMHAPSKKLEDPSKYRERLSKRVGCPYNMIIYGRLLAVRSSTHAKRGAKTARHGSSRPFMV
jgi:hypothetical protein